MKVLVCGSRSWHRTSLIHERLAKLPRGTEIIHGGARGADEIAGEYARALGLTETIFLADWKRHGKKAGIIRNYEMLNQEPDLVLAFWDGKSTGTQHTIDEAENRGIKVEILYEHGGKDWR